MAHNRKTRPPYENWGVPRDRVESDYGRFYLEGGAAKGIREGEEFQAELANFGFRLVPKTSWDRVAYEVRLIQLGIEGLWPEAKGNAAAARECRSLARKIDSNAHSVAALSSWQAINLAQLFTEANYGEHISEFFVTARRLEKLAEYLEDNRQPSKWAATRRRETRLVLACKLAPIFEREFGKPAKPRGGSETLADIRQENEWAQFYQGIAKLVLGEVVTPDRQQILWDADLPSEMPSDPK